MNVRITDPFAELTRRHGDLAAKVTRLEELLASCRAQSEHFLAQREAWRSMAVELGEVLSSELDCGDALAAGIPVPNCAGCRVLARFRKMISGETE